MVTISTDETPRPKRMRDEIDRRTREDRRKSPIDMRLRVGLWYQYHRATRSGEFDPLPRNAYRRSKLQEGLLPEVYKYEFFHRDTHSYVSPVAALAGALDFLWSHPETGCNVAGEATAVYTINAIAEYLCRLFEVKMIDRRKTERRAYQASA
jgi:hypothetical protein